MLRLVHEADRDEYDDEPRRARYDDEPRAERLSDRFRRRRPSVLVRVARTLVLGAGFAVIAFFSYLGGQSDMLGPLFAPEPIAARVAPPVAAPAAPPAQVTEARVTPPAAAPQLPVPDVQVLVMLIRNTIVALHQANLTGDYAVLRAMASPQFQQRNSAAVLSQAFTTLRAAKIDLGEAAASNPRLYGEPAIDGNGFLRLAGFVPIGADKIDFEMAFQLVDGRWRLFGLGVHPPKVAATTPVAAKAPSAKTVPEGPVLLAMIRNAVLGLNQANLSGDYSVLRDLAADGFQKTNSVAKLADSFANLRNRGLDLAPAAVIDPHLFRPAAIDGKGYLRVAGYFPSRPEQLNFDLVYRFESGAWRLFGIGVDTSQEAPATASTQ